MILFFSILLVVILFALLFFQRTKYQAMNKELHYIKERIADLSYTKENSYILVPSESIQIKELAAEINRLLDKFYSQKAEYERSKKAMTQVLTNISHDIRTPLTVLKGYSELLCKEAEKADENNFYNMATKINRKASELVITINEYFTMSKITSGDMKIDLQRTNITELCHEVILDYYDILEQKHFCVEIAVGAFPEYAYVDKDALKRILKNLIDNAIRHGGDGKYLALRLSSMNGKIKIDVEDHGQGILEKDQEQIFYRTYTTTHKGSGSGLGLTIAKNLALQMEADIQVISNPGYKTVFSLILKS